MAGACSCESCCLGGGQTAALNALKNRWQGHVAASIVALQRACGRIGRVWKVRRRANGNLERPEKQMAGACSCESCCFGTGLERFGKACGRVLKGLRAGKQQP